MKYSIAETILEAVNDLLVEQGQVEVVLADLGWIPYRVVSDRPHPVATLQSRGASHDELSDGVRAYQKGAA